MIWKNVSCAVVALSMLSSTAWAQSGFADIIGLKFLSQTTFPTGYRYKGSLVFGLSGIEYDPVTGTFLAVRDNQVDGANPDGSKLSGIFSLKPVFTPGKAGYGFEFTDISLLSTGDHFESVRRDPSGNGLWLVSEDPHSLWHQPKFGAPLEKINLPKGFDSTTGLESLTFTPDGDLWIGRETAQPGDPEGVIRLTRLNRDGSIAAQHVYKLDDKPFRDANGLPWKGNNNGMSEILAVTDTTILILERAFDGTGATTDPKGLSHNSIRIYKVDISGAGDVKDLADLGSNPKALTKTLIFDSANLADILDTYETKIDNIEGMTFGPILPNGHASLVLVSDNNNSKTQGKSAFLVFKVATPIPEVQYWDGTTAMADRIAGGGDGIWSKTETYENWTRDGGQLNDAWNGKIAAFAGRGGTITIDNAGGQVSAETLRFLSDHYVIAGGDLALSGGVDVVDAADTATILARITGTNGLVKSGEGTLVLEAANTYTGTTTVNAGVLKVNGSVATPVIVNAGGTLGGTGAVGTTAVNGGTLAPGDATGTLTINGNLTFTDAATYLVNLPQQASSLAKITGTASLDGTLRIDSSGSYLFNQPYTLLSADGGLGGTRFDTAILPNYTIGKLTYTPTEVQVSLSLALDQITGLNRNQRAITPLLDHAANTNGLLPPGFEGLLKLPPSSIGEGLSQITGELAVGPQQATFNAMTQFMGVMTDPSGRSDAQAGIGPASARSWSVWGATFGGTQSTSGNRASGATNASAGVFGSAVGADYRMSPQTLAGFALGGGGTSFSLDDGDSGRSDLFQAGIYARHTQGAAYVTGALAYGWQAISTRRTIAPVGTEALRASFEAHAFSGRLESGYRTLPPALGDVALTPYTAAQFTTYSAPAYGERVISGADTFALDYASKDITTARTELGVRGDKSCVLDNATLSLRGRLAWAHDFNDKRAMGASLRSLPGSSFVVNGAAPAHDALLTTAAAEMRLEGGLSFSATFEGEFSTVTSNYAGKGVMRYQW